MNFFSPDPAKSLLSVTCGFSIWLGTAKILSPKSLNPKILQNKDLAEAFAALQMGKVDE